VNAIISPHALAGSIPSIASKSAAHRLLILAALSLSITDIDCRTTSDDIDATISCLEALGVRIAATKLGFHSTQPQPIKGALLDCGESGSTLRFLLPVSCALGAGAALTGHGRLAERPLSPLYEELCKHGCELSEKGVLPLKTQGQLTGGRFFLPGDVSSQFASGLLLAAPFLDKPTEIFVLEPVQSAPYIRLTIDALEAFGITVRMSEQKLNDQQYQRYVISGGCLRSPGKIVVEGDWSNAAFWLAAGSIGHTTVEVRGLKTDSSQGDRAILAALARFGARVMRGPGVVAVSGGKLEGITLDVSGFPDLVPPLAAVATFAEGKTRLTNAGRLRLKESDRLVSVSNALTALGGHAQVENDDLIIEGSISITGGLVDAENDHRIAMMAAIVAAQADGPTTICGAQCVAKSYPAFFDDFAALGGHVALHNREEV
jgi:3-phosphoshikimate 1-carboxyvinyltransferase